MFKAAFPWAQQEEEAAEKDYIKGLDTTSSEEVAGNVWIHPDQGEHSGVCCGMQLPAARNGEERDSQLR